jgi:hypothetical protein
LFRFFTFFRQIDNFTSDFFLWATGAGVKVARVRSNAESVSKSVDAVLGDEGEDAEGGEG